MAITIDNGHTALPPMALPFLTTITTSEEAIAAVS